MVKFKVEVIDNTQGKGKRKWGDINPATGKVEGSYGAGGGIREEDSEITEENGYSNIVILPVGTSPHAYIEARMKEIEQNNSKKG
ncbi:MAG: hypothetical protein KDH96_04895 [Candidatus Riesia sp.]|nr:hypothetical protein [Candidatus Riesia sp.]